MSVMQDLKDGFAEELNKVITDDSITFLNEVHSGYADPRIRYQQIAHSLMNSYGSTLVTAAVEGLTEDRLARILSEEWAALAECTIPHPSTQFRRNALAAVQMVMTNAMKAVCVERAAGQLGVGE